MFNIVKHAQAGAASISVDAIGQNISIVVTDDGIGFDVREVSSRPGYDRCFGLFNIRERLTHLGGSLEVSSLHGQGTHVTVIAPMKEKFIAAKKKK
jgi:signal transduction histidine kinase